MSVCAPLLVLKQVGREFPVAEGAFYALKDIDLRIEPGEMVAIVGPSGCGKSTLMNIVGCLDRVTSGSYHIAGLDTTTIGGDSVAALRRDVFGFVFQRHQLLDQLTALANVEMPGIYSGLDRLRRKSRALELLGRLGLATRSGHKPNELSGGQQQRVAIARALMNCGQVILADEPTGSLDRQSREETLEIFRELNQAGHTIVIVTHDAKVATHAERIIELRDGEIASDHKKKCPATVPPYTELRMESWRGAMRASPSDRFAKALSIALGSVKLHRLRTGLAMLGIIIGIASVVSVVAMGKGSQQQILQQIAAIGTNTIDVYPGSGFGDIHALSVHTLVPADADALAQQPFIDSATPLISASTNVRLRNASVSAVVNGVGADYFRVHGMQIIDGVNFDQEGVLQVAQEVVIDDNTRRRIFARQDPLGAVILIGAVPCRVIGVASSTNSLFRSQDSLNIFVPYTTAMVRILGTDHLRSITLRVRDSVPVNAAEQSIVKILKARHRIGDFFVNNNDVMRRAVQSTGQTLTLLIFSIALISLTVGGIGLMNIMLASVTERTREIGIRMAVGARRRDILQQFLLEALLICLIGGAIGVALARCVVAFAPCFFENLPMIFSQSSTITAFVFSTLVGITFGYWPARNAARLSPVEALARE